MVVNKKTRIYKKKPSEQQNKVPKRTANVIGATGLVGKYLVNLLLDDPQFSKVRIFVRRDSGISHPKLEQKIIDFREKSMWENQLNGDILFSALGTTLKKAGSKEKQYEIDFRFNLNFANAAKKNGINTYILVSAVGANSKSKIFYNRMKGELDEAILNLGFPNLAILRPSALEGKREDKRTIEKVFILLTSTVTRFIFKRYRPIHGKIVARAMINASLEPDSNKTIWNADEIFELAEE